MEAMTVTNKGYFWQILALTSTWAQNATKIPKVPFK